MKTIIILMALFMLSCMEADRKYPCTYDVYQGGVKIDSKVKTRPCEYCRSETYGGTYYKVVEKHYRCKENK